MEYVIVGVVGLVIGWFARKWTVVDKAVNQAADEVKKDLNA